MLAAQEMMETPWFTKVDVYADGADISKVRSCPSYVKGFTTNPTLCRAAGITDYKAFCAKFLETLEGPQKGMPVSFEVFADDLPTMEKQAITLSSLGSGVFVKIPVVNTQGVSTCSLIERLSRSGVKINVTAVFTKQQIDELANIFSRHNDGFSAIVSVFCGRISDAGEDPVEYVAYAKKVFASSPHVKILWASFREVRDVVKAIEGGCDIITIPPSTFGKLKTIGKDLDTSSVETVQMFYNDAKASGFTIPLGKAGRQLADRNGSDNGSAKRRRISQWWDRVAIYADGAELSKLADYPGYVRGFTTNPSLCRGAGILDYMGFCKSFWERLQKDHQDKPLSLQVLADDLPTMKEQALELASLGRNVFVKIPVVNTQGVSTAPLVEHLSRTGVKINVTAVFTKKQLDELANAFSQHEDGFSAIVSVCCGHIADAGADPVELVAYGKQAFTTSPHVKILWESFREVRDVVKAIDSGCDIITIPPSNFGKLKNIGKDLTTYSMETVKMFYDDAKASGFSIPDK
jgi:transaldolase